MRIHALMHRTLLLAFALTSLTSSGCKKHHDEAATGCQKDTDCKGSRVCVAGSCEEPPSKDKPAPAATAPRSAQPPKPPPPSPPNAPPPSGSPGVMAADGLPAVIPPPSSPAPTSAEWDSVTREVTVKGSSAINCETKMLREWLRVNCKKWGNNLPLDVEGKGSPGQQAYVHATPKTSTSVVVQVVQGKTYNARFSWQAGARVWGSELTVSWPQAAARPVIYFDP